MGARHDSVPLWLMTRIWPTLIVSYKKKRRKFMKMKISTVTNNHQCRPFHCRRHLRCHCKLPPPIERNNTQNQFSNERHGNGLSVPHRAMTTMKDNTDVPIWRQAAAASATVVGIHEQQNMENRTANTKKQYFIVGQRYAKNQYFIVGQCISIICDRSCSVEQMQIQ